MAPEDLSTIGNLLWLSIGGPLLLLAGLWLTVRLGAPQLSRLGQAFRGLRETDPDATGTLSPVAGLGLAAVASHGAAAAVGAATAVSLGGAGSIGWIWLFCLVVAPLRYAETWLSRTHAPGAKDTKGAGGAGSLAARLRGASDPMSRGLGWALLILLPLSGLLFVGGTHGAALIESSRAVLPGATIYLVGGAAVAAAILAGVPIRHTGAIAGYLAIAAFVVLTSVAAWACFFEPGRIVSTLGRAVSEAFAGAPGATPFVGALAGQVAFAAVAHVLPALGAATGVIGSAHAEVKAVATRRQAATAMLGPLVFAVIATVVMVAIVGTGAFSRRVTDRRPLTELTVYSLGFETLNQQQEADRLYGHGGPRFLRLVAGELRDTSLEIGTERGLVRTPRFYFNGEPADLAVHIREGKPFRVLAPSAGTLKEIPLANARRIEVEGEMLPRGGRLLGATMERGTGGPIGGRSLIAALFVLLAVAATAFGFAAGRPIAHGGLGFVVRLLPAAGLGLAAAGLGPWISPVGAIVAAITTAVAAFALLLKVNEVRKLHR